MKIRIEVMDFNDPKKILDYYSTIVSICCSAPTTGISMLKGKLLSQEGFQNLTDKEKKSVVFPQICTTCGEICRRSRITNRYSRLVVV